MSQLSVSDIEDINRGTAVANAILHAVGDHGRTLKDSAEAFTRAIDKAGFEIVPKAKAGRPYLVERTTVDGVTTVRTAELVPGQETATEKAVREQDEISARISEARRLGDWSRVTDRDMLIMMSACPGGRTYGNDEDLITRIFSDAGGGSLTAPMLVLREVSRLREKIITAWAGGRGSWDADAFAKLQELAPRSPASSTGS